VDDFKNMFASPPSMPGYTVTEQAATYKSNESSKHATESYEGRKTLKAASKRQAGEKKLNDTQEAELSKKEKLGLFHAISAIPFSKISVDVSSQLNTVLENTKRTEIISSKAAKTCWIQQYK
jgi:hypothetical protein